ncbi:HEAT repeat domain-containing protein [Algoriphagus sp.]|uniref:HEAT repeat domain-containing protein n=1 Tax=Algoriphagus sp. TaxID=1872435 RepID=UPI00391CF064
MEATLLKIFSLLVFFFASTVVKAQEVNIPVSKDELHDFLILQAEVPGLKYRFFLADEVFPDSLFSDSLYSFTKTDSGLVSQFYSDFSQSDQIIKPLLENNLKPEIQYLVFSEIASTAATREYISNLLKSGDFLFKLKKSEPSEDIVALASYARYSPMQKFKLKFISDLKLLLVTIIIGFFFTVASFMIGFMLIMKVRKNKKENLLKEYDILIIEPLTNLLFERELQEIIDLDQTTINDYFPESMLSKQLFNEVLMDRIIGLNKKMKGEFKEKLKALYKKLNLDKISIDSLNSKRWDKVAMGLVQINEMDLREALPKVQIHANSENFQVRSQAVATLLNLSEKVDLKFLRDQTFPLSLWQQMNYLRIIKFVSHQKTLKIEILFDSQNLSIRIFGYKLVKMLGRVDLIEVVANRAREVSDEEKIEILDTYASLGAHMEVGFVNSCLKSDNSLVVLTAAYAAYSIGDTETADILTDLIRKESDFRRKMTFSRSLYELDKDRFDQVISSGIEKEDTDIKRHILDPMLQNV